MLYDDAEQLEVRHVLSLALYDIDLYAGSDEIIPEGELWVKRNCIRLVWRETSKNVPHDSKPFYLFSDNCSEKEDFYHALLQNQDRVPGYANAAPRPLQFDSAHIVKLVQQLHASEENLQTRWINAMIGRLFLALYQTSALQELVHKKITKKIARVPKPTFIESISVKRIDLGDSAPLITNPKLRELTIDGDLTLEADVKYKGNLRIEIAAVARIDLGPRFKARRVDLLLAGICKSLEGHILIRVKPPPSNRLWFTFDGMPKLDLSIEPIVSSRQITYSVILRAIESRIREVIGDTLVLPNWDDIPFSDSSHYPTRGGLWSEQTLPPPDEAADDTKESIHSHAVTVSNDIDYESSAFSSPGKSLSTPALVGADWSSLSSHSATSSTGNLNEMSTSAIASGNDLQDQPVSRKPRTMRSTSFATAVVGVDPAVVHGNQVDAGPGQNDATKVMMGISARSQPTTPAESPVGSPSRHATSTSLPIGPQAALSYIDADSFSPNMQAPAISESPSRTSSSSERGASFVGEDDSRSVTKSSTSSNGQKRQSIVANAAAATSVAKKWGLDLVARHSTSNSPSSTPNDSNAQATSDHKIHSRATRSLDATENDGVLSRSAEPIGRGHPLPPPVSALTILRKIKYIMLRTFTLSRHNLNSLSLLTLLVL
jgi:hypothetical protein